MLSLLLAARKAPLQQRPPIRADWYSLNHIPVGASTRHSSQCRGSHQEGPDSFTIQATFPEDHDQI